MRVLFQSPPIGGVRGRRPDGSIQSGNAFFIVKMFEATDSLPSGFTARRMSEWRRDWLAAADGTMRIPAPDFFTPPAGATIPDVVIPAAALRDIPDDALVSLEWRVVQGHGAK